MRCAAALPSGPRILHRLPRDVLLRGVGPPAATRRRARRKGRRPRLWQHADGHARLTADRGGAVLDGPGAVLTIEHASFDQRALMRESLDSAQARVARGLTADAGGSQRGEDRMPPIDRARWRVITSDAELRMAVDRTRVERIGRAQYRVWVRSDYARPEENGSVRANYHTDVGCVRLRLRAFAGTDYDFAGTDYDARGDVIDQQASDPASIDWMDAEPESAAERLARRLCHALTPPR